MSETYAPLTLGGGWRTWAVLVLQLALTAALALMLPGLVLWQSWRDARALQAEWTVHGPPCEQVESPASWALNHGKGPRTFNFLGTSFTRQFAAASCASLPESWWLPGRSYQVCMFNNPGAVTVSTIDGPVTFQPPFGQRATITVRNGDAACVVGGRFGA